MRLKLFLLSIALLVVGCAATPEVKVEYYPDGRLRAEWEYEDGKKHGKGVIFDRKGHPSLVLLLKQGKLDGTGYSYEYSGYTKSLNGILHCSLDHCKVIYPALNETGTMIFRDGYPEGLYSVYYPDGKLQSQVKFIKGERQGRETGYYDTGAKQFERDYLNNELNGMARYYYPGGELRQQQEYNSGAPVGESITFYKNGKIKSTAKILKTQSGYSYLNPKEYFENGNLKSETITTDTGAVIKTRLFSEQGILLKEQFPGTGKSKNGRQPE